MDGSPPEAITFVLKSSFFILACDEPFGWGDGRGNRVLRVIGH
jgi:hypothetical protein